MKWTLKQRPCHSATCRNNELHLGGKNNYTLYRCLPLWTKQGGKGKGNGYSRGGEQTSILHNNRQQQPRLNGQFPPRQGEKKTSLGNHMEGLPGEQVWIDNVKASAREKTWRLENTLTLAYRICLNQEWERERERKRERESSGLRNTPREACCGNTFPELSHNDNICYRPIWPIETWYLILPQ